MNVHAAMLKRRGVVRAPAASQDYWLRQGIFKLLASEGRMTIPFANSTPSGVLDIWSHVFEFIPESEIDSKTPIALPAHGGTPCSSTPSAPRPIRTSEAPAPPPYAAPQLKSPPTRLHYKARSIKLRRPADVDWRR